MSVPGTNENKSKYFPMLDFMRGMAAICVMIFHWINAFGYSPFGSSILAVDFFFLLSGFVIASAYQHRLQQGYPLTRFILQRLIRLYPMIVAGAVCGFVYFALKSLKDTSGFDWEILGLLGLNLIMFPLTMDATQSMFPLNIPMWSLFFELLAYLAFGVFLLRLKTVFLLCVLPIILVPYTLCILGTFGSNPIIVNDAVFETSFFWRLGLWFIVGMLIFRGQHMIEKIRMGTGICVSVLTLLVILFILPRHLMAWWQYELLLLVLLPLSIVAGLKFEMKAHWIRLAHISGNLSYPLYLIHLPVMFFLSAVLKTAGVENGLVWYGIIILPITMVCAYMLYLFYDLPVRSWLGRRLQSLDLKRAV